MKYRYAISIRSFEFVAYILKIVCTAIPSQSHAVALARMKYIKDKIILILQVYQALLEEESMTQILIVLYHLRREEYCRLSQFLPPLMLMLMSTYTAIIAVPGQNTNNESCFQRQTQNAETCNKKTE